MQRNDKIEIVEAAYALDAPHESWQRRLTELVAGQWDGEAGSLFYDASNPDRFHRESVIWVGSEMKRKAGEGILSVPYPPAMGRRISMSPGLHTIYELGGASLPESRPFQPVRKAAGPEFDPDWFSHGVNAADPSLRGLTFCMSARPITPQMRRVWGQLATHIAIAYRLRRELESLKRNASAESLGEAIVDLDGRCRHADGEARSVEAREILREAARAVMRARSSLRSRDPDEALEIWQGLVDGRWSLVDRFDSDGQHYLVAHRNPPQVRGHRALTAREAEVAGYLAMGMSNKSIGYALGIGPSTVADRVASIERKLGLASRAEVVRLLAAFATHDSLEDARAETES